MAFMTPENSFLVPWRPARVPSGCEPYPKGDCWAEPDLGAAASLMRQVYDNPALARDRGRLARADVIDRLSPERTARFIRERLSAIGAARQPPEPAPVREPDPEPPPVAVSMSPPPEPQAVPEPAPPEPALIDLLADELELAQREAAEAERMLVTGISFRTSSRFGWPGQLLRTAVLRLLRPYAHFEARYDQRHLQSTTRVIECLRRLNAEISSVRPYRAREASAAPTASEARSAAALHGPPGR
jgi:hypothetical protein